VVLLETARHWEEQAKKVVDAARLRHEGGLKGQRRYTELGLGKLGPPPPVPDTNLDKDVFVDRALERLTPLGVEILPVPTVDVSEILYRDLAGKKPFANSGKGFRDTLIWLSAKSLFAKLDKGARAYLVSANTTDYCLDGSLHPDLATEVAPFEIALTHVADLDELVESDDVRPLIAGLATSDEALAMFLRTAGEEVVEPYPDPTIGDLIQEALEEAASVLVGEEIATGNEESSGFDFTEVHLPDEIETPIITQVGADPGSVEWETYETYDEDTLLIRATIEADVEIEGFVFKGDYGGVADEVRLLDFDATEHYAAVAVIVEALLVFQMRVEAGAGFVESTEFELAEGLISRDAGD